MTLLVTVGDARASSPTSTLLAELLEALEDRFPHTLVLVVCRESPAATAPHPLRDWVRLGPVFEEQDCSEFLVQLIALHQAVGLVTLGDGLRATGTDLGGNSWPLADSSELHGVLEQLDAALPLCCLVGPNDQAAAVINGLSVRPHAPEIRLFWTGGPVPSLRRLVDQLLVADDRPLRVQVGLSEIFRGTARRVLLGIPAEVQLRLVAEDEISFGVASATEAVLRRLRRERPRSLR